MLNIIKKKYFILLSTFFFLYFFFNLLDGERGLISYFEKKQILEELKNQKNELTDKINNLERLKIGFLNNSANSILIKLNQIGTVTETLEVINFDKLIEINTNISHR